MTEKFRVQVLNHISANGLRRLPWDRFAVSAEGDEPHAILLRSADLHGTQVPATVLAIGRAGSGTNNIPVAAMSARGIPVFNAPGANANAVKELVLAGMLLAARNLDAALRSSWPLWTCGPRVGGPDRERQEGLRWLRTGRSHLGVVGLGKIGCLVADAAIKLGMHVIGYDPAITVDSAWSLPSTVKKAERLGEVLKHSHFVTAARAAGRGHPGMIDAGGVAQMKPGAVVLNFSRSGVVDEAAVLEALADKQLGRYVCDFPSPQLAGRPG